MLAMQTKHKEHPQSILGNLAEDCSDLRGSGLGGPAQPSPREPCPPPQLMEVEGALSANVLIRVDIASAVSPTGDLTTLA